MSDDSDRIAALVAELESARGEFAAVVGGLRREQLDAKRLVGEWGLREIVAHLGYWAGNAAEAMHQAELGSAARFGVSDAAVEERNALVARVARETDLATARAREEAAFAALVERVDQADPAWLDEATSTGETVGSLVHEDGVDHYREHAGDLRIAIQGSAP